MSQQGLSELSRNVSSFLSVGLRRGLKVVISDGMVSGKMFSYVDQSLRNMFANDMSFGGVSILCVSDFNQFSSVMAKNINKLPINEIVV